MPLSLSDTRQAFLVLSLLDGLGARSIAQLLTHFPDPGDIFKATGTSLRAIGCKRPVLDALASYHRQDSELLGRLEQVTTWLQGTDCQVLSLACADYPALLREITDPPPVLYLRGDAKLLHDPQLAMVGSRNPGPHGAATAQRFARSLTENGLLVTSGMALGIDGACHQGALDAGGQTIAVWGTGLDHCYPRRHLRLAEQILDQGGLLVSEQPPYTAPQPGLFPRRNRIISGLSLGTLVVEASLNSGSLITARLALEQNREVFAMPGSIHSSQAKGCHQLLRQGAHLVETVEDVLNVLSLPLKAALESSRADSQPQPESELWGFLDYQPVTVDWLSQHSGLAVGQVLQQLLELELEGLVQQTPQGFSRR